MFTDAMSRIEICGKSYPYRCDMVILERIQSEFGDVVDFENAGVKQLLLRFAKFQKVEG